MPKLDHKYCLIPELRNVETDCVGRLQTEWVRKPLQHTLGAEVFARPAVHDVANPPHGVGLDCGLRLASHSDGTRRAPTPGEMCRVFLSGPVA